MDDHRHFAFLSTILTTGAGFINAADPRRDGALGTVQVQPGR